MSNINNSEPSIQLLSVSHETAPIEIRRKLALTREKQRRLSETLFNRGICSVVLCTCNRFEVYTSSAADISGEILAFSACGEDELKQYSEIKCGCNAVRHLFETAAGLRSMVLGEDQILGQIKTAAETAREGGFTDAELNTAFRLAVTSAKRIKTDTLLSKTPVSVAGTGLKAARSILGKIESVLIIGAGGGIGSIILKDLINTCSISATVRKNGSTELPDGVTSVDYEKRYDYIDGADLIVSATSAPHIVLSGEKMNLKTKKKRVFLDLAVPPDMDIEESEDSVYINIDGLKEIAVQNNKKRISEAKKAEPIIERYMNEYSTWLEKRRIM